MSYPIKTLNQLPLILKGFRKEKQLTQAAMGEKLGITQQSYAAFEAHPAAATLDRLYMVLRLLDVEISLDQVVRSSGTTSPSTSPLPVDRRRARAPASAASDPKSPKATRTGGVAAPKKTSAGIKAPGRVVPARKKESW